MSSIHPPFLMEKAKINVLLCLQLKELDWVNLTVVFVKHLSLLG